jgi:hypothetical protein
MAVTDIPTAAPLLEEPDGAEERMCDVVTEVTKPVATC